MMEWQKAHTLCSSSRSSRMSLCVSCVWRQTRVHRCGSVYRWRPSARLFYQLVNCYLCSHSCTSVCEKGPLQWESGAIIKQQRFLSVHKLNMPAHISQRGLGEQVDSHRDIWCAPRWRASLQHRPLFVCVYVWVCVHFSPSDDHLCPALQRSPFCSAP